MQSKCTSLNVLKRQTLKIQIKGDQTLQISMHALMGIRSSKYTFTVTVMMGQIPTTALIDSGSTATFFTPNMARNVACKLSPTKKGKVAVANGGTL